VSDKPTAKILVVDDEQGLRDLLSFELSSQGYKVSTASDGAMALDKIRAEKFQVVISDINMPKVTGLEALAKIKEIDPDVEVIMMTGFATIETAVDAMKKGAYDFVRKPFNMDEITALVEKVLEKSDLKAMVAVYESSKALFSSIDLKQVLPIIGDITLKILKADHVSVVLVGDGGKLKVAVSSGMHSEAHQKAAVEVGVRVMDKADDWKELVFISGPVEKEERLSGISAPADIKHTAIYPLRIEKEFLGILFINRIKTDTPFVAADLRNLTIFGSQIAQAVNNARLYRELQEKMKALQAAQEQLIQSEKLAAIGQLAAGVAHELNNPLTGVIGFTQLLMGDEELVKKQGEALETIHTQAQRCREIVEQLLTFSRKKKPRRETLDLIKLFEGVYRLIKYDLSKAEIKFVRELPESLPAVWADNAQLQQVLLNLTTNAMYAMEGLDFKQLTIRGLAKDSRVLLQIQDTGKGIADEVRSKIFDPFFTTKPLGKGTGLGLSISYGIVESHGGVLRVESEVGVGTTFTIDLPADTGDHSEPQQPPGDNMPKPRVSDPQGNAAA